jgi:two-component system phosphate regulon sensor histidine kinase PhoR
LAVEENKFNEQLTLVTYLASQDLTAMKGNLMPLIGKGQGHLANEFMQPDLLRNSIAQRYTVDEIKSKIRKAFVRQNLGKVPFEFCIRPTSIIGEGLRSENFDRLSTDTANNVMQIIPLVSPGGSSSEGISPEELLIILVPHARSFVWKSMSWFIAGAIFFTIIILSAFFLTIQALLRQKKLSEIKSDFINNMTHEFKTPLATISLAVDALRNDKVTGNPEKRDYFIGIIKEENSRMNKQVETILQAALLDRQEVQIHRRNLSAHELIKSAVNKMQLQLQEKQGRIELQLNAGNDLLYADEVHFTNLISNLLDNAMKYSRDAPVIQLTTQNSANQLRISIADNGIGMNKETLGRIFEKFYRAHTGNLHNVKGFGLGLSYVKTMVDAHQGTIRAESMPGKGSVFTLSFPTSA